MKNIYIDIKKANQKLIILFILDMAAEEYNAFFYSLVSTVSDNRSQVQATQLDPHHKRVSRLGSCEIFTKPSFLYVPWPFSRSL